MMARRFAVLAALVTMGASGYYVFIYLARWEWNRAVVAGVIFLAAEIALLGLLLFDRIAQMQRMLSSDDPARRARRATSAAPGDEPSTARSHQRLLARVNGAASAPRQPFAWLKRPPDQLSVFVPVLLGAGVFLSGIAWLVERIARFTAGPTLERNLARRLEPLALPPGGLLGDEDPSQPSRRRDPFSPAP